MMQTNRVLDYSDKSCPILTKVDVVVHAPSKVIESDIFSDFKWLYLENRNRFSNKILYTCLS